MFYIFKIVTLNILVLIDSKALFVRKNQKARATLLFGTFRNHRPKFLPADFLTSKRVKSIKTKSYSNVFYIDGQTNLNKEFILY